MYISDVSMKPTTPEMTFCYKHILMQIFCRFCGLCFFNMSDIFSRTMQLIDIDFKVIVRCCQFYFEKCLPSQRQGRPNDF